MDDVWLGSKMLTCHFRTKEKRPVNGNGERNNFSGQAQGCVRVDGHGFWPITLAQSREVWLTVTVVMED